MQHFKEESMKVKIISTSPEAGPEYLEPIFDFCSGNDAKDIGFTTTTFF